jgi:hypothetical protein
MGEHSAPRASLSDRIRRAATWVRANRRTLALAAILAVPVVSRYVPDFPVDAVLTALRGYLGAP